MSISESFTYSKSTFCLYDNILIHTTFFFYDFASSIIFLALISITSSDHVILYSVVKCIYEYCWALHGGGYCEINLITASWLLVST